MGVLRSLLCRGLGGGGVRQHLSGIPPGPCRAASPVASVNLRARAAAPCCDVAALAAACLPPGPCGWPGGAGAARRQGTGPQPAQATWLAPSTPGNLWGRANAWPSPTGAVLCSCSVPVLKTGTKEIRERPESLAAGERNHPYQVGQEVQCRQTAGKRTLL